MHSIQRISRSTDAAIMLADTTRGSFWRGVFEVLKSASIRDYLHWTSSAEYVEDPVIQVEAGP
jgi:hypothetical protein